MPPARLPTTCSPADRLVLQVKLRFFTALAVLVPACGAATSREPAACGTRPCTYVVTCAAPVCTAAESAEVQAALNEAQPGDTIKLEAGRTFASPGWRLPAKDGSAGWITLTTTRDADLPDENTRITPAYAPLMPLLTALTFKGVISTENGPLPRPAERYKLTGLAFSNAPGVSIARGLLVIGNPITHRTRITAEPGNTFLRLGPGLGVDVGEYVGFVSTGTLPGGLQPGIRYYVVSFAGGGIRVSTSRDGAPVAVTDSGTGEHFLIHEGVTRPEHQAKQIVVDRCYFTATTEDNVRRAIGMHGVDITVRNSFIEYSKDFNTDAQAILSYNGAGPYTVENNFLEGAAENVLFGGAIGEEIANPPADPQGVTPADILFRYNYLPKNPARFRLEPWRHGLWVERGKTIQPTTSASTTLIALNSGYTGTTEPAWPTSRGATVTDGEVVWKAWSPTAQLRWVVKNNFEIKAAERARFQFNVTDGMWAASQSVAVNIKSVYLPRASGEYRGRTENILFRDNVVRSAPAALVVVGIDRSTIANVKVVNNLFYDIDAKKHGIGLERQFMFLGLPFPGLVFEHNTAISGSSALTLLMEHLTSGLEPSHPVVFRNNILQRNPGSYGVFGAGSSEGMRAYTRYLCAGRTCDENTVSPNVIAGVNLALYPSGTYNLCPGPAACDTDLSAVRFVNPGDNDYALSEASPFRGLASDGTDMGVDMRTLPRISGLRAETTSTKAVLHYTLSEPIQHIPCVLQVGLRPDFSESAHDVNPTLFRRADSDRRSTAVTNGAVHAFVVGADLSETAMDGQVYSRALTPDTRYHFRLQCGGDTRSGEFRTKPGEGSASVEVPVRVFSVEGATGVAVEYGTLEEGAPEQFPHTTDVNACESACEFSIPAFTDSVLYYRVRYKTAEGDVMSPVGIVAVPKPQAG
jgi:hypothetical protein